jgi:predicted RNA-binding Zn ribbon-like protein
MATLKQKSAWKDGFLFVGNHPALDFVNTRPVQNGEAVELLPDFSALLRWFQAAGMLNASDAAALSKEWAGSARASRTVEAMHALRERLRKDVQTWEAGGTVRGTTLEELNRLMARYPMRVRLKASKAGYVMDLWFEANQPEHLFAPLAHHAARLIAEVDYKRVHKCGACVLHFHDTSKKGTRRWCSMQLCGNRFKVAAYAERARSRRLTTAT